MNIIVTGATSMIGVSTIEAILKNDNRARIFAVVRPDSCKISRIPNDDRVHIIECDGNEYALLPKRINKQCDIMYHFAWKSAGKYRNHNIYDQCDNICDTLDALTAANSLSCKKFIGSGSQAEYGLLNQDKISPDSIANPSTPYGIAKYAAGKMCMALAEQYNMDCFWTRVFSIYGPLDRPTSLVSYIINGLLNGKKISCTPAEQRWDYLYSADAGNAFYLIGKKSTGRKIYCLGSGKAIKLKEYVLQMQQIINPDCLVGIGALPYPDNCVMNMCADISELQKDTGWNPSVSFEDGVHRIVMQWTLNE